MTQNRSMTALIAIAAVAILVIGVAIAIFSGPDTEAPQSVAEDAGTAADETSAAGSEPAAPAREKSAFEQKLEEPGPLGDIIVGADDAPVTIIEYASLTCSHCGAFHRLTWPQVKENYVDTGLVRFIFREFPFDGVATAGFMAARCAPEGRYHGYIDVLFEQQSNWVMAEDPIAKMKELIGPAQGGMPADQIDACLQDEDILNGIRAVHARAKEEFGVNSTPTFFINGDKIEGNRSFEEFEEILKEYLPDSEGS